MTIHFVTNHRQKSALVEQILESDKPLRVEIEVGDQRTIEQNKRHWALINGACQYLQNAGIWTGDSTALHIYCKRKILGEKAVTMGDEVVRVDIESRKLSKKNFKLFDEKLEPFLIDTLKVPFEYLLPPGGNW